MMPRKIMLVDDDADLVSALGAAIELAGYAVETAGSGAEALAKAPAARPDVIVLDVTMETAGAGFKAARALRANPALRQVPLIMLTAINREEAGLRFGPDEDWNPVDVFLDKPVAPEKLLAEIKRLAPLK